MEQPKKTITRGWLAALVGTALLVASAHSLGFMRDETFYFRAATSYWGWWHNVLLHGLEWIEPPAPFAHPLDDGSAAVLERSLDATCTRLGQDGPAYRRLVETLVRHWFEIVPEFLVPIHIPRHPFLMARLGMLAPWPAATSTGRSA